MSNEDKEEKKAEQKENMVNLWMTDLNQTPEEKAEREAASKEKEAQRERESK